MVDQLILCSGPLPELPRSVPLCCLSTQPCPDSGRISQPLPLFAYGTTRVGAYPSWMISAPVAPVALKDVAVFSDFLQ